MWVTIYSRCMCVDDVCRPSANRPNGKHQHLTAADRFSIIYCIWSLFGDTFGITHTCAIFNSILQPFGFDASKWISHCLGSVAIAITVWFSYTSSSFFFVFGISDAAAFLFLCNTRRMNKQNIPHICSLKRKKNIYGSRNLLRAGKLMSIFSRLSSRQ